ncbi:virulence factor, partial [Streptomyces sp. NPDC002265]
AVADAIKASQDASAEAKASVKLAGEAAQHAKDARTQANAAGAEAAKALAASAKAAGFAYVTAQAAVDAGKAAEQVADPANDAIQIGSAYVDNDSAAALVVLTGQSSKTIGEQQQAVADAHARNAAAEAQAAKNLADQAKGDAKEAYQHAADAARYAADARTYSKEALGYAADAAKAASAASASLARTVDYDNQATEDAAAADRAAGRAEGYAKDARDSADAAELDASAARSAAAQAEQDAKDARTAADRADAAATEAEQAAKEADKYAKEAQDAADRAEKAGKAKQIDTGTVPDGNGGWIGNMFYVVDRIDKVGDPEVLKKTDGCDGWIDKLFYRGDCTITEKIRYTELLDLYLCTAQDLDPMKLTCPSDATQYLGEFRTDELSQTITHTITIAEYQSNIDPVDILFGSWIKCAEKFAPGGEEGSWGGCAWAGVDVASLFAGKLLKPIADAITALDASARTGIEFEHAWNALRGVGLSDEAIAGISTRALRQLEKGCPPGVVRSSFVRTVSGGGAYCKWLELGGPGTWIAETEGMSQADRAYEQLVTEGVPSGISYKVPASWRKSGYVKFDGYQNGTLIDAKNQKLTDRMFTPEGKLQKWVTEPVKQAKDQARAAGDVPIIWYVSDERTATAFTYMMADEDIKGITVVFRHGPA